MWVANESVIRVTESRKLSVFYLVIVKDFNKVAKKAQKEVRLEMLRRKGQSTLEYVLILTAIIAAVIVVSGKLGKNVESSLEHVGSEMENQANKISF